jgi:hypothetical protein
MGSYAQPFQPILSASPLELVAQHKAARRGGTRSIAALVFATRHSSVCMTRRFPRKRALSLVYRPVPGDLVWWLRYLAGLQRKVAARLHLSWSADQPKPSSWSCACCFSRMLRSSPGCPLVLASGSTRLMFSLFSGSPAHPHAQSSTHCIVDETRGQQSKPAYDAARQAWCQDPRRKIQDSRDTKAAP